jgi:hypothetical protein
MALMSRATHMIQWPEQWVAKPQGGANPIKSGPSSDKGLQLDPLKLDSLVTAGQLYRGEYVPRSCTHRPSRHGRWKYLNPAVRPTRVGSLTGTKS